MKNNKLIITILAVIVFLFPACDDILDKTPVDRYSEPLLWSDIELADAYLLNTYRYLWHGYRTNASQNLFADEVHFIHSYETELYLRSYITADNLGIFTHGSRLSHTNWSLFQNIQRINIFLDRIDEVTQAYPEMVRPSIEERVAHMKGQAIFIRAWCYAQMARLWGGLPIMREPWEIGDDYLAIERASFEETINSIVEDIDAAFPLLKYDVETESGRVTKGTALALKSRILLFAASDLTADGNAASNLVGYENPNRTALWSAARDAAKAVIDLGEYELADFGPNEFDGGFLKNVLSRNYHAFFKQRTLNNPEIIWGKMFVADVGDRHWYNRLQGRNGNLAYASNTPTQFLVDNFQMADGTDFFDHFYVDEDGYYRNKGTTHYRHESPYLNREPRFYGSIMHDSTIWAPRFPDLAERDPVGIYDRRTRIKTQGDTEVSRLYGIDTRNGPVQAWNASYSGYITIKGMDETHDRNTRNENVYIWFRYAEILLNYAEACLELGDEETASEYINMIRNRAGLPDFTGDIEKAYRHERLIELNFEDHRWHDMRRWRILLTHLTDVKGMDIQEIEDLANGTIKTTWRLIHVQDRDPSEKIYWLPIQRDEMNRAPQLVQNPYYD